MSVCHCLAAPPASPDGQVLEGWPGSGTRPLLHSATDRRNTRPLTLTPRREKLPPRGNPAPPPNTDGRAVPPWSVLGGPLIMLHPTPRRLGLALVSLVVAVALVLLPATAGDKGGLQVITTLKGHTEE